MRNTSCGEQESDGLLETSEILRLFIVSCEAGGVVIVEESQQAHRVGIHQILCQIIVQAVQSATPIGGFFVERLVHVVHQREVHHRLQVGVAWSSQFAVLLPEGNQYVAVQPSFAHDVEVRIFIVHFLTPVRHEVVVGIRVSVLADAVDAGIFYPPDATLDEETCHVAVALVQVRHSLCEPSVHSNLVFIFRCVDILHAGCLIRGTHVFRLEVEPVLRRLVAEKEVVAAAVVENHVHHHFQSLLVCFFHQLTELFIAAIAAVHLEIVGDGITVIRAFRHVVFLCRVQPDGGYAQIFQIVQMVLDTLQIATVTAVLFVAVHLVFQHPRHNVVVRIAVGEAVGHDEVEHVAGIETFHFR